MKWHQVRKVVETTTALNVNTSSSSSNKAAEKPALKSNRVNMTNRCDTSLSMRGLSKLRTAQAGAHTMTRAFRSVMTGAALTLGGLKAAHAATMGVSLKPGHRFSAVARTGMRTARSGIALALLAGAGLAHAVMTTSVGVPFTVPNGLNYITVHIAGGSGGGGGLDTSPGGPAGYVPDFSFELNVAPGDIFTGTTGAGGQAGMDYVSCSGGGAGGSGDTTGGNGGNAGCESVSGGGGGGGGGTSLVRERGGIKLQIFLAAGSGGGGGGSYSTTSRQNSAAATNNTVVSADDCAVGRSYEGNIAGEPYVYNGGGGGGGGGGYVTGKGGIHGVDIWQDSKGGNGGTSCQSNQGGIFSLTPTIYGSNLSGTAGKNGDNGFIIISYAKPADPAQSGVNIVANNNFASGMPQDANRMDIYLRDSNGDPMGGELVTFDATPNVAYGYNYGEGTGAYATTGAVGAAGSCVTDARQGSVLGRCVVYMISTVPGTKTTAVRLSNGQTLSGNFTYYGGLFTPSPAVYTFVPYEPRLRIVKTVTSGSGTNFFKFSLSGLSAGTDSIAVTDVGSGNGQVGLTGTTGLGVTISESSPAGWPVNPVSASCVDANYAGSGNSSGAFGTLNGNVLSIPVANMLYKADITCTFTNAFSFTVTGHAFTDNGIGGGIANDGVMNGGELGLRGVKIKLTNCAGRVISTATTDGNGAYSLSVPFSTVIASFVCVEKTTLIPRLSTGTSFGNAAAPYLKSEVTSDGSSYIVDKVEFQWNGTGQYDLNFGDVEQNTFVANGTKSGPAGNSVSYSHSFNAKTGGSVSFSVAAVASPVVSGWNQKVFADTACTGSLQAGAALLFPPSVPVTTTAGQIVCVVMQEFIPLTAPLGYTNTDTVQASFTFTNAAQNMSATYSVTDVTTSGKGALDLTKEVRNVTTGGAFGMNNQAKSGETLEYRITYVNNGADPISGLSVTDVTPNHTTFVSASNGTTPAALTNCQKQTPANPVPAATVACDAAQASGGTGSVSLRYVGSVGPGAIGVVLFQVKVD